MKEKRERLSFNVDSAEKIRFMCLLVLFITEFVVITCGQLNGRIAEYITENYLVLPGLVFLGASAVLHSSSLARRNFCVGLAMVAWFVIAQMIQYIGWEKTENISMWWSTYLLVFPFAAATKDGEGQNGLLLGGTIAIAGCTLLALDTALLKLGILPEFMSEAVYWDGARLTAMWHPNITACLFMIGIAFCLGLFFRAEARWKKGFLLVLAAGLFCAQVLTNSRTSILLTCALVAGVVFFWIFRGGWKRFAVGILAASVVFASLFMLADAIYDRHYDSRLASYNSELQDDEQVATELPTVSGQGSFSNDLKTLNGRTEIWKSALRAIRYADPAILLKGSADVPEVVKIGGNGWVVGHTHNSWMEMLVGFGLPGLLLALYMTLIAVRGVLFILLRPQSDMWRTCVALLVVCLLLAGILEPFLFTGYYSYEFAGMIFFLATGYVDLWREESLHPERV